MRLKRRSFLKISGLAGFHAVFVHRVPLMTPAVIDTADSLFRNFVSPDDSSRASCYWWWFNGLVDKEGIRRDLEEFRSKGMGGVLLVNSADGLGGARIPQGVKFLSEEWKELYRFAMQEAKRLGIEVGINLSSGWCMGGPWIQPENAGRWYLQSTLELKGPQLFEGLLPLPGNRAGYDKVFNPPGYKEYIDLPLSQLDYRDTAVVAIRTSGKEHKITGSRAALLIAKANRKDASNFAKSFEITDPVQTPWMNEAGDQAVPLTDVIDLTRKTDAAGKLRWEVPPGTWTVVRTGHRMTGSKLMIAQPEANGLSVDWFDRKGVDLQFQHLGEVFLEEAAKVGAKPAYFCDDSFEDGFPNWTPKILGKFRRYRGYDATPYLPVLSGYIIGSAEISDRFLNDYRKTIADCMADEHYGHFAALCHQHGLQVQNEAAGPSRSGTICMDGLKNLGRSDLPMGEFWLAPKHEDQEHLADDQPYGVSRLDFGQNKVTKMVAAAAHIYGKKLASAEAFTSFRHWLDAPGSLKQALDRAFCEGINRIVIHTSTATRPKDGLPGYEYGAGTHFNPNVTWWEFSAPFFTYVARCQYLLRAGHFVADVLFYNGDVAPNLAAQKKIYPALGKGYDYDVCNEEVLLERLQVRDGKLTLPDGMQYHILVLPESKRMPVAVIKKIKTLLEAGALVMGAPPQTDSGLAGYPQCDAAIQRLAETIWKHPATDKGIATGKGRLFYPGSIRAVLKGVHCLPDFETTNNSAWIDFIHRTTAAAEVYFITNRKKETVRTDCLFRVAGRRPQIWDPVSGRQWAPVYEQTNGRTKITLDLDVFQSAFIVFPKEKAKSSLGAIPDVWQPANGFHQLQELAGSWEVRFDPQWGGPATILFEKLQDWSRHPDPGIRYYSGKATYSQLFHFNTTTDLKKPLFLDLGVVKNICRVWLNETDLGIVWTAPWRVEVTGNIKQGANTIRIEVINLWPNRLIGDAALPPEQRRTRTNITFKKEDPLLPSGLLGPVRLVTFS
ncbi:glycosyl transferase family 2 [Niabella ginsenosidivorans]|uniref:Glycosyl transferase family 2 n=1 Tax=Niabella ginsenosidivorans TaxID=1176587 RepID=A0A1A9I0P9_9BACT|nr:glycosyl hydrolase [Niabella ginsenosidivorans]ANH80300.1 glycosyl transferase family 2 [Niabella ginsenosidivorans]